MGDENIKVVVRCRPLNSREIARGAKCLISMVGNQTFITRPDVNDPGNAKAAKRDGIEDVKSFTFDKSYWSFDKNDPNYATQAMLYNDLGEEFLDYAFEGYNTCIFAYGQTGAGKSYSMMGYGEDKGIMPLTCCELFNRINNNKDPELTYQVQVSYIEIYNERVRDLLNPKNKGNLEVREHPALGPYVVNLPKLIVNSFIDIEKLMEEGNKFRTVSLTNMIKTSSRTHAIFTLLVTQKRHDTQTNTDTKKVSRISFVDLAGSEHANSTYATRTRLKEVNQSLTTFGKVISALAEQSSVGKKKGKKEIFVPYKDSVLTWLLKDSLGGNSKTAMIAAISPADYYETLSTLRYAEATRRIKNKVVVNKDPNARLIRELKEELPMLRSKLGTYDSSEPYDPSVPPSQQIVVLQDKNGNTIKKTREELIDQTQASEKLMEEVNESWAGKARKIEEIREKTLKELRIMVEKNVIDIQKKVPHIVNLDDLKKIASGRKFFYDPMEWIKKKIEEQDINYFEYSEFSKFIEIGRGGFGIVSKAETNDNKQVALKGLTNSVIEENVIKNLVKELKLLRMVSYHDNINRFLGITNDHAGNYIMVLEYADEGNLRDYLKVKFDSLQWENKIRMALDIACGLKCLHSRDIVHRDLHSKNILVNKGRLLIADFGLSKHLAEATSNSMGSRIGIIEYVEPQCLRSVNYVKDKSSDVYSLGVLLWEITSGRPPFCYTKERDMLGYHIGYMNLREEPIEGTPLEYQQLYQKCWDGDPKKRPDINHVFNEILNQSNANDTNEQCEVASNNNKIRPIRSMHRNQVD